MHSEKAVRSAGGGEGTKTMKEGGKKDGECRVAMAGRSVMGHWFKFWNFPDILSRYAIYFPWPVPYKEYVKDGYRLEYIRISPPHAGGRRRIWSWETHCPF